MTIALEAFFWGICVGISSAAVFCRIIRKRYCSKKKERKAGKDRD